MSSTIETAIEVRPSHVDIPDEAVEDGQNRKRKTASGHHPVHINS